MQDRNINLDIIRLLGILVIMIAHAAPPGWLFQLRNFGTPLLIVASALTYSYIYRFKKINIKSFYRKRLKRLIFPAWVFLSFFFMIVFVLVKIDFLNYYPFGIRNIIETFAFYKGIGFVWIFKVYIILALITPLGLKLKSKFKSNSRYYLMLILLYMVYELLVIITSSNLDGTILEYTNNIFLIILPYSVLYFYGLRLSELSNKSILAVSFTALLVFIILAISKYIELGEPIPTQNFKYPPTIYYLSYAFFALNMVYMVSRFIPPLGKVNRNVIIWLSSNSLWIYLWHIMAWYLWSFTFGYERGSFVFFTVKFCWLISFGITLTYFQTSILTKRINRETTLGKRLIEILT